MGLDPLVYHACRTSHGVAIRSVLMQEHCRIGFLQNNCASYAACSGCSDRDHTLGVQTDYGKLLPDRWGVNQRDGSVLPPIRRFPGRNDASLVPVDFIAILNSFGEESGVGIDMGQSKSLQRENAKKSKDVRRRPCLRNCECLPQQVISLTFASFDAQQALDRTSPKAKEMLAQGPQPC